MAVHPRKNKLLKTLTLVGCFSTGIIYASIGTIALLSFFRLKKGGADESSFFVLLNGFTAGRILNWLIIIGALCFIIWRFAPNNYSFGQMEYREHGPHQALSPDKDWS